VSRASRVDSAEAVDEVVEVDGGYVGVGDEEDDVVVGEAGEEAAGERVGGSGERAAGRVGVDGHDRVWGEAKIFPVNLIFKYQEKARRNEILGISCWGQIQTWRPDSRRDRGRG
jgi:hypothetical protein